MRHVLDIQSRSSSGVARLLRYWMGGPDNRDGTSSNHDKMISLHFLIDERSVRAKLQPTVESAQRLRLIDVEDEDNGGVTQGNHKSRDIIWLL